MAIQFGKAGLRARQIARNRYLKVCFYVTLLLAAPVILHFKSADFSQFSGAAGMFLVFCIGGAIRFLMGIIHKEAAETATEAKDSVRDARAKEKVALQLSQLPEAYFTFHDIDFKRFSVDHLVLGPPGIFVIKTKSHSETVAVNEDTLLLNGEIPPMNFLNQVWSQTKNMQEYLWKMTSREWKIKPVLCFTNAYVKVIKPFKGVNVVGLNDLNTLLQRGPANLEPGDVENILQVLNARLRRLGSRASMAQL